MVNSMVSRATSSMLMGPDWAMNLEICDICNRDPGQAKDVIKGIKKRLGNRNPKVQLLALTLLESIVKNCGDVVHLNVAERNLLHDMVKIAKKKKPDYHVKEKILILIDTWQEAFGGERGRYPQYYVAYLELLRLGATFPEKSASMAPVLTPPQTQPITSVPHNLRNPENENETGVHTAEPDFPTLSLTEMQNARGVMDVLAEMLSAVDPAKKEGLRQEVIVDLVEQCRTYKKRLVHLVNSTSDESLLSLGLALNDDLQRVLAKHEALLTTTHVVSSEKSKPETSRALVPVTTLAATDSKQVGSASGAEAQPDLISLAPVTSNGPSTSSAIVSFDLLSGDDFDSSPASNALAIVPVGETRPATPVSQQNALALVSVLSPQTQQPRNMSAQQSSFYPNRNVAQNQSWAPNNQGSNPMWNGHMAQQQLQQQQQPLPGFGVAMNNGLPLAPWEAPQTDNQLVVAGSMQYSQPHGIQTSGNINMSINNQMLPMNNQQMYTNQMGQQMYPQQMGQQIYPQQMGQQMYTNQMSQQMYPQQMGQQMYTNQMGQQVYTNQMGQQVYTNQMGQQVYTNQMGQQMYPQQMGQQMYNNQMSQQMYTNQMGQVYGYGQVYAQQQNAQYLGKSMPGMPARDDSFLTSTVYTGPSMANASYVHVSSGKGQKAEDKLFGDLLDFSKVKPKKMTPGIGERV